MKRLLLCLLLLSWGVSWGGEVIPWHDEPQSLVFQQEKAPSILDESTHLGATEGESRLSMDSSVQARWKNQEGEGMLLEIGKTVGALLVVCALAYLVLSWGLPRFGRGRSAVNRRFRIIDKFGLEPKKTLYLMEIQGSQVLLASSEQGMSLMELGARGGSHSENAMTAPGLNTASTGKSFMEILQTKLDRPSVEPLSGEAAWSSSKFGQGDAE